MDDSYYKLHAELEESYWWFVAKNRIILDTIRRFGPAPGPGVRACDVGCGSGGLLRRLAERFDATGVDMSPIARAYCRARGLKVVDGGLPDRLPFEPASFDVVVASEVLEHVPDDRGSVAALVRLLRPGGLLVCTVPAHQWMWSRHDELNHHQRRYARAGFAKLFDDQPLERVVLSPYQVALFPVMAGARLASKVRSRGRAGGSNGQAMVRPLPRPVNALFRIAFESEKPLLGRVPLPPGGSLISVHRRR